MAAPIGEIIAGAVEGTFNTGLNLWNTILQQQKFDYDKAIQQKIFEREDTGVQRRMADLQAAGLNPQLAAGSAAGAGSVVSTQAPQFKNIDIGAMLDTATALETIKQQKLQTQNQIKQNKILDLQREITDYARRNSYYDYMYNSALMDFMFNNPSDNAKFRNISALYSENPYLNNTRFWEQMKYQFQNQKNSADLLQKQNDWFNANQILGAIGSVVGDVTGLAGGFGSFTKGMNLLRPKFNK